MRIPRIFSPQPLHTDQLVELEANAARHLTRVLRLRVGDEVTLFNGEGGENGARIDRIERERVWMRLGVHRAREVESPLSIILGQGISRGERMDYTLQKAVELGVGEIYPLATERSVVRLAGERVDKKITHWQGVVNSACEQSGRNRVPKVHAPLALPQWLTTIS
ncbi:MAG: 16S rRNA (uracil(1498)-N(3))-methyltransferase, partial [Gammaproteobacteria bacterium]|nr:16S rRNA (uracil(1498)-N(3))-methyltransferase [Gammaproteobacteria bacterium]